MKRIILSVVFLLVPVLCLFSKSYNDQGEWYNQHKIGGLRLMKSYDFSLFVKTLSCAPDSIDADGNLLFVENTMTQNAGNLSPINIPRTPRTDRISILEDVTDMSSLQNKVTLTGFNLRTPKWAFNDLIRVGDSIEDLHQLGGSCYTVSPYESMRNWGVLLWSPEESFPDDLKFIGSECVHFYYDNEGIITGITLYLNML